MGILWFGEWFGHSDRLGPIRNSGAIKVENAAKGRDGRKKVTRHQTKSESY